ncbi:hypothetical protein [Mannheimia indoligenes]|uniref:hypothetical protein n=1 Tax=Mannheimia indoligenes TaxID=3103145 RepID=UPI002FE599EB
MKPTFKTTAVAILVALGVSACSSSNDSNKPVSSATLSSPSENQTNSEAAKAQLEKAKAEAEKKAKEAEQARLEAEKKAKQAADAKAKQEAEQAQAEAQKKAQAAEQARLEAEKKAAELKAQQAAEKARLEAEKQAQAAEQARLEAEQKAKQAADAKAKQEAEKARLEAEKKAKEAEQARLEAEKKAAELKAQQEAEKVANKWRGKDGNANITDPRLNGYSRGVYFSPHIFYDYPNGYDGTKDEEPILQRSTNNGYKLDYYQLAIDDKANPQLLGWHKGEIKSGGINGSEIVAFDAEGKIAKRAYPEKVDYMFKNTPYSTYGAVYNNYASNLFASYEKESSLSNSSLYYQVGEYEVIDGNQTNKIKYNDAVKGAAIYKGEVVAHAKRYYKDNSYNSLPEKTPKVDGSITINANFGPRAEENYASAILESNTIGKLEFPKSRIEFNNGMDFSQNLYGNKYAELKATVVGKEANEIVGEIYYRDRSTGIKAGDVADYEAVFAAEKQPK